MALRGFGILIRQELKGILEPKSRMLSTTSINSSILKHSPNSHLNKNILKRFRKLKYDTKNVQATYIWIDGTGEQVRAKDRILNFVPEKPEDLPTWMYDGSSTYQALTGNSDTKLVPRAIYRDPFRVGPNDILVLCDTYTPDDAPTISNLRAALQKSCDLTIQHEPWFGFEQEYTLMDIDGRPLGWPTNGFPAPQGPYFSGVGAKNVVGRDIVEAHILACLYAGVQFGGTNAEVMPAQWEYQVGPGPALKAADDLWISRYMLHRVAEDYGVVVTLDPKPVVGDWNGAGGHANFSTKSMRAENGIVDIEKAIGKLSKQHKKHIEAYDPNKGKDNARRLVGRLETSSIDKFSWGVADRSCSVRIPRGVAAAKKGYLEDRRPSSNCDPYSVSNAILTTILLDD